MKLLSRLRKGIDFRSETWHRSEIYPEIRFAVRTVSLRQRLELLQRMQQLMQQHEFLKAGDLLDQAKAREAELLTEQVYLEWAVTDLSGFRIDGSKPSITKLIEQGPERLSREMVNVIRGKLDLSEEEIKN